MWNRVKSVAKGNKKLAFVSFANLINNIISIIAGLIVARWLLPQELGFFNVFSIFTSYIILAQIGIPSGLSRELPFYFGKNDPNKAHELASTSKYFLLLISIIVFAFCFFLSIYYLFSKNFLYAAGAIVIGVTSFQGIFITKYLKILYRSDNHFVKLSKIALINSAVNLISLFFVYKFLLYGLCLRAIVLVLVDWYFTNKWKPIHVKSSFNWQNFKELSKVGMPMYFVSNLYSLWPTFQRTFVISVLGAKGLGLFALASIVQAMLSTFNSSISSMSFPLMSKAYGEGKKIKDIMMIPFKPFLISVGAYILILLIGWPMLPYFVEWLLPNYVEGVYAAQLMFIVALVSSLGVFSNIFLVIQKNQHRLVGFTIGISAWFIFLTFHSIRKVSDLFIFSQAVLVGLVCITICDFIFYYFYLRNESVSN